MIMKKIPLLLPLLFFIFWAAPVYGEAAEQLYRKGEAYFAAQPPDYPAAERYYLQAAEMGHGAAQMRLGFLYGETHFHGVADDLDRAEYWLLKAAEQNAGDARFRLGNFYLRTRKPPQMENALKWLQKAAEDGHAAAQYDLALLLLRRENTDAETAQNWMQSAAGQGNLHAMIMLSRAHRHGLYGFEKDAQKSVLWAERAAERTGSVIWYTRIADAYYTGEGNLPPDREKAALWYEKAAKKGDGHAARRLSEINKKE